MSTTTTIIPTLTYFNNQGKAEIARLILAYNEVQFNDVRVEWPISDELRPNLPFGVLPYYEDADIKTGQSVAIARYLANKYNIAGKTLVDSIKADALVDSVWDLVMPYYLGRGDAEKLEKFKVESIPKFLNNYQSLLIANGGKYFVGDSLTWADLAIYFVCEYLSLIGFPDALPQYETLVSFTNSISSIPSIQKYIQSRPVTQM
eukprot:gene14237-16799_t